MNYKLHGQLEWLAFYKIIHYSLIKWGSVNSCVGGAELGRGFTVSVSPSV